MRTEISSLQFRISQLEGSSAHISTESKGYGVVRTPYGNFYVFNEALVEYLDGYKVTLVVVNPTSVTFKNATVEVSWGPPFDKTNAQTWSAAQKSRELPLTESFPPGVGVPIEVVLTPAKPQDVKRLYVGLALNQINYQRQ